MNLDPQRFPLTLGRTLDPGLPAHRALLALMAGAFLIALVAFWGLGQSGAASALDALRLSAVVFFAWALGRETDPDHNASAFVAVPIAMAGLLLLRSPDFLLLLWVLLLCRLTNRSVGRMSAWGDDVALGLLAAALVWRGYGAVGWMFAATLALDGILRPRRKVHLAGAVLVASAMVPLWVLRRPALPPTDPATILGNGWVWAVIAVAILSFPGAFRSIRVVSVGDSDNQPLSGVRVAWAQLLVTASALLAVCLDGTHMIGILGPLWAAIAGTMIVRTFASLRSRFRANRSRPS